MRHLDPVKQYEIICQTYASAEDIYHLYPIGRNESARIFNEIVLEMTEQGIPMLKCRPRVIPLSRVLKKYPVNKAVIKQAAKEEV